MRPDEHQRMFELEDHYWWFVGRKAILRAFCQRHLEPLPGRRILDIGCGTGGTLAALTDFGTVFGLDPFHSALRFCGGRGLTKLVAADATRLPVAGASVDLVTAFDVFEHIADDRAAFAEAARVVRPGGGLLLTVPAYPFLWSEHDVVLEHHRRYVRRQIGERLDEAGFDVVRLTHCICFLLPPTLLVRLMQRLRPPHDVPECGLMRLPEPLNRLCLLTLEAEAALLRHLDLPCGVSVLAFGRRR